MDFYYTLPLQRHLNLKLPSHETASAAFFCWDIHLLTIRSRKTALAMNRGSRYSILLYGMTAEDWACLPELVLGEIKAAILREGLSEFETTRYFALAGPLIISISHDRPSIAALNWAMRALLRHSPLLDDQRLSQPQVVHIINDEVYHALPMRGSPRDFFLLGFQRL